MKSAQRRVVMREIARHLQKLADVIDERASVWTTDEHITKNNIIDELSDFNEGLKDEITRRK